LTLQQEQIKAKEEKVSNDFIVLSWQKEDITNQIQVKLELSKELQEKLKYDRIEFTLWKYTPSKNFTLDTREARWVAWYTYMESNQIDYTDYPYTSYIKINRKALSNWNVWVYPALVWLEYKIWDSDVVYSTERIEANNYNQIQEVEKYLIQKVKTRQELVSSQNIDTKEYLSTLFSGIKIASENWWWWDWYTEVYKWINKITLESDLEYFAWILFKYKLQNDPEFKKWFDTEIERQQQLNPELNIDEIKKWVEDWIIKATRDYLMQYIDLAENLSNLTLSDISNWLNWIWNTIKQPKEIVNKFVTELYDLKQTLNTALDKLVWLWTYEKTYWWTYIWTTLWFIIWNPW
jgi:outer membrane receptor for monomeric catechols